VDAYRQNHGKVLDRRPSPSLQTDLLYMSARASSPGSGGGSWIVASQTVAALRIATSLATPAPTPVAIAQLRASVQEERRSAGIGGGVSPRTAFHTISRSRCVARPAKAPDPSVIAFQPYLLNTTTASPYPGSSFTEHAFRWRRSSLSPSRIFRSGRFRTYVGPTASVHLTGPHLEVNGELQEGILYDLA